MEVLYTPDSCFEQLPDYPFNGHYFEVEEGIKMHYLDEGPSDGEVVLLMHGEPSWSYLYRHMIPVFAQAGFRVIAPDLIGFGKSAKPTQTEDYQYIRHIRWCQNLISHLKLHNINFFGQDWGGLIGLRMITADPDRYARIVVANTGMPTGDQKMPKAFLQWQQFSQTVPVFPFEAILQNSTQRTLSPEELGAYKAPYPDDRYIAGARIFPALVPSQPDNVESENNRAAWKVLMQWTKPLLTLFSDSDPITKGGEKPFLKFVPGAVGQPHHIIEGAGHFLQEDKPREIAQRMIDFIQNSTG